MTDVFDHPWLSGLFGDAELSPLLSADRQLADMRRVELAYTKALGAAGVVPENIAMRAAQHIERTSLSSEILYNGTAQDGMPVPALSRALKASADQDLLPAIHKGLTSQDVIDTALMLAIRDALPVFRTRIETILDQLARLDGDFGRNPMSGRTRMQLAESITVSDRVATWAQPLATHLTRLEDLLPRLIRLQFGGAAGDRKALGDKAGAVARAFGDELGLPAPDKAWHAMRDGLAEFAGWLSLVSGTLGKIGTDMCLMAQQGVDDIRFSGGGTSSAMPHKQNPILAELLVTLARFNAAQLSAMHGALLHEQERSGAAWTLEWMLLPQMMLATGRGLTAAQDQISRITRLGESG